MMKFILLIRTTDNNVHSAFFQANLVHDGPSDVQESRASLTGRFRDDSWLACLSVVSDVRVKGDIP